MVNPHELIIARLHLLLRCAQWEVEDLMRRRVQVGWVRVRVRAAPGRGSAATDEGGNLCAALAEGSPQERMHAAIGFAEEVQRASLEGAVMRGPLLRPKPGHN